MLGAPDDVGALWRELVAAGARPIGADAYEIARVEAGVPRFGAEIDASVLPAETGLVDQAVSFTKGCYVGQEPVARLHYRGHPNRHLRHLVSFDGALPTVPAEIALGDRVVGRLTSVVQPPGDGPGGRPRLRPARGRGGLDRGRATGRWRPCARRGSRLSALLAWLRGARSSGDRAQPCGG